MQELDNIEIKGGKNDEWIKEKPRLQQETQET